MEVFIATGAEKLPDVHRKFLAFAVPKADDTWTQSYLGDRNLAATPSYPVTTTSHQFIRMVDPNSGLDRGHVSEGTYDIPDGFIIKFMYNERYTQRSAGRTSTYYFQVSASANEFSYSPRWNVPAYWSPRMGRLRGRLRLLELGELCGPLGVQIEAPFRGLVNRLGLPAFFDISEGAAPVMPSSANAPGSSPVQMGVAPSPAIDYGMFGVRRLARRT